MLESLACFWWQAEVHGFYLLCGNGGMVGWLALALNQWYGELGSLGS